MESCGSGEDFMNSSATDYEEKKEFLTMLLLLNNATRYNRAAARVEITKTKTDIKRLPELKEEAIRKLNINF